MPAQDPELLKKLDCIVKWLEDINISKKGGIPAKQDPPTKEYIQQLEQRLAKLDIQLKAYKEMEYDADSEHSFTGTTKVQYDGKRQYNQVESRTASKKEIQREEGGQR
jgi:hypothetical protein